MVSGFELCFGGWVVSCGVEGSRLPNHRKPHKADFVDDHEFSRLHPPMYFFAINNKTEHGKHVHRDGATDVGSCGRIDKRNLF